MLVILLKICAGLTLLFSCNFQTTAMPAQRLSMNDGTHGDSFQSYREEDGSRLD
jgi:hypothetical protein